MSTDRRHFMRSVIAAGLYRPVAESQGHGEIILRFQDAASGRLIPARVRLLDSRGRDVLPRGHTETLPAEGQEGDVRFQSRRFFYSNGMLGVRPDRLPLKYQVIRGYEYVIGEGEIRSEDVRDGAVRIPLSRWSSLAERGWYSGDIHIRCI